MKRAPSKSLFNLLLCSYLPLIRWIYKALEMSCVKELHLLNVPPPTMVVMRKFGAPECRSIQYQTWVEPDISQIQSRDAVFYVTRLRSLLIESKCSLYVYFPA
jgi:hypothetical protein